MKSNKITKKLIFNKKTVADLNVSQMFGIRAGEIPGDTRLCIETETCTCPATCPAVSCKYLCEPGIEDGV